MFDETGHSSGTNGSGHLPMGQIPSRGLKLDRVEPSRGPIIPIPGVFDIVVPALIDAPKRQKVIEVSRGVEMPEGIHLNACCRLWPEALGEGESTLALFAGNDFTVVHRNYIDGNSVGVAPRKGNDEQNFAYALCTHPRIRAVALAGMAGTGKTLMALKAGAAMLANKTVKRIMIFPSMVELGRPMGYLPGTLGEKVDPWTKASLDALELIYGKMTLWRHLDNGTITIGSINHLRGRTLSDTFILVDDAQNFTAEELKAVGTRAGEGSWFVITGDPGQIDNRELDANSSGFAVMADRLRGDALFGSVQLVRGERSRLATVISERLHEF